MALPNYIPSWLKTLRNVCPQAATYIDDLDESVERYRAWVIKQNNKISELNNEISELNAKINKLKIAVEDARGLQIALEAYIYEACGHSETQEPF